MANFCAKCGRQINEMEQEDLFSLNGYGMVCQTCYKRSANIKSGSLLKGNIWTTYFKLGLYLLWIALTLAGLIFGGSANGLLGAILFGGIGFIIGFMGIASTMIFITLAEDMAIIRKNTLEISRKLERK